MKARPALSLNFLLLVEARPASVHTTNFESLKSDKILFSKGFNVTCSFVRLVQMKVRK